MSRKDFLQLMSVRELKAQVDELVLQKKNFAFELFFCWANAGFFTFSSKTSSIVPISNLCRNIQRPKKQINQ